ncbi:class 3 adenylate cyclase [Neolewinella xylanilytica]|uniref:Class 3 adenylate cyclase n=1 Tax=Neolewinella xylanilytica TaxID=1514080 RepID=A0A2S6I8U5_9BACT|nr:adenylate/guanylate cyclase domain-containing protein [Neolewinella xylanilytica]PPK87899.1 class 3 adenylate cyclase [Neolewinella xylanilytica]
MEKHSIEFTKEGCVLVSDEANLLDASLAAGIPLYHVCGGKGKCSTCRVLVHEGANYLTPPTEREEALRQRMHFPPDVRLACQTCATGGPVRLSRILRDESDMGLYVGPFAGSSTQQIGEERDLVLLFLDIRNFTPFIERHLAFDVIHIVRKLFTIFQELIEGHDGRIIETAGDGIYAAFGFDAERPAAATAAVRASRAMLDELVKLNESYFRVHFNHRVEIGIGIHLGRVIMGSIRIAGSDRLLVMGYPVNIAARLQDATKTVDNDLLVSAELYGYLDPSVYAGAATTVALKGVGGDFQVVPLGTPYSDRSPM